VTGNYNKAIALFQMAFIGGSAELKAITAVLWGGGVIGLLGLVLLLHPAMSRWTLLRKVVRLPVVGRYLGELFGVEGSEQLHLAGVVLDHRLDVAADIVYRVLVSGRNFHNRSDETGYPLHGGQEHEVLAAAFFISVHENSQEPGFGQNHLARSASSSLDKKLDIETLLNQYTDIF